MHILSVILTKHFSAFLLNNLQSNFSLLQVETSHTDGADNFVTVSLDKFSVTGFVQGNLCVLSKVNSTPVNALLNRNASYLLLQGSDNLQAVIGMFQLHKPTAT